MRWLRGSGKSRSVFPAEATESPPDILSDGRKAHQDDRFKNSTFGRCFLKRIPLTARACPKMTLMLTPEDRGPSISNRELTGPFVEFSSCRTRGFPRGLDERNEPGGP